MSPELKQQASEGGVDIEAVVEEAYFAIDAEEQDEFYDFHEPMKKPTTVLKFNQNYRPLNIEFSNSKHLLIEGSLMDMNVGVYKVVQTQAG